MEGGFWNSSEEGPGRTPPTFLSPAMTKNGRLRLCLLLQRPLANSSPTTCAATLQRTAQFNRATRTMLLILRLSRTPHQNTTSNANSQTTRGTEIAGQKVVASHLYTYGWGQHARLEERGLFRFRRQMGKAPTADEKSPANFARLSSYKNSTSNRMCRR
jgi:hypothetical protein